VRGSDTVPMAVRPRPGLRTARTGAVVEGNRRRRQLAGRVGLGTGVVAKGGPGQAALRSAETIIWIRAGEAGAVPARGMRRRRGWAQRFRATAGHLSWGAPEFSRCATGLEAQANSDCRARPRGPKMVGDLGRRGVTAGR